MGQYYMIANLDKREFVNPHEIGSGLKAMEILGTGTACSALTMLMLSCPERRGGGDPDDDSSVHKVLGRWAGDRVAIVGDYAQDDDLPNSPIPASKIYAHCADKDERQAGDFVDISGDVARALEAQYGGKFVGEGWKSFWTEGMSVFRWKPVSNGPREKQMGVIEKLGDAAVEVRWEDGTIEMLSYANQYAVIEA